MRYPKGSISISTGQDVPLLRQVLHSRFITHDQLFEFMRLGCYELKRSSFNWRIRRLVTNGFINRYPASSGCVYSVASAGASLLAVTEDYCSVIDRRRGDHASLRDHALELNELHLGLARQGVLEEWIPEVVIRSRNELTREGYAKDYDAIVRIRLDGRSVSFALEYERTPKKPTDYQRIRNLLEVEDQLPCILYVVPNGDLASFLLDCFAGTTVCVLIAFATSFSRSFRDMKVFEAGSGVARPVLWLL